jgi:transposase
VQLCCAHLLRALRGIGELDTDPYRIQRTWTEPAAQALLDAKAAVAKARATTTALDPDLLAGLRARYDQAIAWGILTNHDRDWPSGRHPGYLLASRLQARAAQVWRFTVDLAVPFTNNPCEQPPQPHHPPTRRTTRRPGRQPLDATANRLTNHRPEWILMTC